MHHLGHNARQVEDLLGDGTLKIQDLGYLFVLIQNMTPSGRIPLSARALASRVGVSQPTCSAALKRLREQHLLALCLDTDTRGSYFLVNPWLVSIGSSKTRAALWAQFRAAVESGDTSWRVL
jgi:DNA-binding transcriptional ArsR family regulator